MIICYMLYENGMRNRNKHYVRLEKQWQDLKTEKLHALALQDDLLLQINSQSDPAWVELTLMKGLGLVPEGHRKIYFSKECIDKNLKDCKSYFYTTPKRK